MQRTSRHFVSVSRHCGSASHVKQIAAANRLLGSGHLSKAGKRPFELEGPLMMDQRRPKLSMDEMAMKQPSITHARRPLGWFRPLPTFQSPPPSSRPPSPPTHGRPTPAPSFPRPPAPSLSTQVLFRVHAHRRGMGYPRPFPEVL